MRSPFALLVVSCLLASLWGGVAAQRLDSTLRIVVPVSPGGGVDRTARIVAEVLRAKLQVPVIVENRSGADGRIAAQHVKATPAGDNVLLIANPTVGVLLPMVSKSAGYDPQKDFVPVSLVRTYLYAVAVDADSKVRTARELIDWLRSNPDKANIGVPGLGSPQHLFALLLADAAGIKPQIISYRGSGPLLVDLMGGQIPLVVDTFDNLLLQHKAAKLRVLAVSGASRAPELPAIPTLKELGVEAVGDGWTAFFAPASMPAETVELLGRSIHDAMTSPEVQRQFRSLGMDPVVTTPQQAARIIDAYRRKWEPIARASGVKD